MVHPQKGTQQTKTNTLTRPKTYEVTLKSILTFPLRICNPPPAVGKVRSCGVTPLFKVRLEDILDRNHLPPLGLKDFEEWVLYVEMSPENLYFTLWLREYRERYAAWEAQNKLLQGVINGPNGPNDWDPETHHSPSLALFYLRAKQTFFTPNSPYELSVPSSLLAIFHSPTQSPHPDPALFHDVAVETWRLLDESLRRFVSAQFNNVGNNRVLCGIIAGILFVLIGTIPPLTLNFVRGEERWSRLAAFPGLFLGLAIFVSAFHGVCLGVYIFGDLRQLRRFELARPPISRPVPAPAAALETASKADHHKACSAPSLTSLPQPETLSVKPSATVTADIDRVEETSGSAKPTTSSSHEGGIILAPRRPPSVSSDDPSVYSGTEESSSTPSSYHPPEIHVSAAIYDNSSLMDFNGEANHDEGQVVQIAPNYTFPALDGSPVDSEYTYAVGTAGFIHPFHEDPSCSSSVGANLKDYEKEEFSPAQRQPMDAFDFDTLPAIVPRKRPSRVPVKEYAEDNDCCSHHRHKIRGPGALTSTSMTALTTTAPSPSYPSTPKSAAFEHSFHSQSRTRLDSNPRFPEAAPPKSFLERRQSKCDINKWRVETQFLSANDIPLSSPSSSAPSPVSYHTQILPPNTQRGDSNTYNWHILPNFKPHQPGTIDPPPLPHTHITRLPSKAKHEKTLNWQCPSTPSSDTFKKRSRWLNAVPAFAVPLTRVLSPVIRRGQWEIVVRSGLISLLVSWIVVGVLLALPVPSTLARHAS